MTCYMEHANITVENLDEAIRFFTTAFPHFKVRGQGESDQGGWKKRWLHLGTDETYVALEEVSLEPEGTRRPYRDPGINHVGFVVDDVDAVIERLGEAGYKTGIGVEPHPHRKRAYFHDRDGNEYEFVEYLSADPAERNDYSL
ncbi:MAG: VOC family protein [Candidatus Poribacteria bacterium]|nr:VOC family protein [Candidatus Poribacteria bacterium]